MTRVTPSSVPTVLAVLSAPVVCCEDDAADISDAFRFRSFVLLMWVLLTVEVLSD